jgi:hypothetical protein
MFTGMKISIGKSRVLVLNGDRAAVKLNVWQAAPGWEVSSVRMEAIPAQTASEYWRYLGMVQNADGGHVLGECGATGAHAMRRKWAERMWAELSAELAHQFAPLDVRVANAVRRLWSLDEHERLRSWAPGTVGPAAGAELGGELQRLLEAVARAGSWSTWMGVFDRGWMELLQAGGMSYARARRLTKRLCRVIRESRSEIARARNERQQRERQRSREAKERELNEAVTALHARDDGATVTLERLLESPWRVREGYRRRRERVEKEVVKERRRQAVERERLEVRRKRRKLGRKRERLVKRKRLKVGVQVDVRRAMAGVVRAADVENMSESEHESESSGDEGAGGRSNADPEAEARVAEAVRLEEEGRRRRAARARLIAERGERQRQAARALRRREGRKERRGRRRREQDAAAGGRRAAGSGGGRARKRRRRVIADSDSDSDGEGEALVAGAGAGASVQATLTVGRLVAGSGGGGGGGSAEGSASGEVGGLGGVRHRAAVAEARRRLGGGGKRGWVG